MAMTTNYSKRSGTSKRFKKFWKTDIGRLLYHSTAKAIPTLKVNYYEIASGKRL